MILNDTLQKHQDCLEQCVLKRVTCETEQDDENMCNIEETVCECDCDFDFGS